MALPLFIAAAAASPIVSTIIRGLVGTFIVRVIASLGFAIFTYNAVDSIAEMIKNHMMNLLNSGGQQEVVNLAAALGVFSAAKIIFSAYVGAIGIKMAMGLGKKIAFGNSN